MEKHTAKSVQEYVDLVFTITSAWMPKNAAPTLWFRGVKSEKFNLIPGAYFLKNVDELTLALYFKDVTPPLLTHQPLDEWEWYYAMQHYGLPTRLLDWSESPLSALYFALEEESD